MTRSTRRLLGATVFFVALWLLWLTPVVFPLKIFVVLLHEISHGAAAIVTGGTVERIVLFADEGGATYTRGGSPFLILSAGYLGSLLWGVFLIEAAGMKPKRAQWVLAVLAVTIIVVAVLYVRNLFGFVFTACFGLALLFGARTLPRDGVANVLLALGLTSALYALLDIRSDILARPHVESDAVMLDRLTGIPAVAWGLSWITLAGGVCYFALRRWLKRS